MQERWKMLLKIHTLLCSVQNAQHTIHTPLYYMLPHHQITYNDVTLPLIIT